MLLIKGAPRRFLRSDFSLWKFRKKIKKLITDNIARRDVPQLPPRERDERRPSAGPSDRAVVQGKDGLHGMWNDRRRRPAGLARGREIADL
jgi:hypothetical protein